MVNSNIIMKSDLRFFRIFFVLIPVFLFFSAQLIAQDEGFIYGKITTIDDNTYQGQIRWGDEEAFWTDMFNAGKRYNDNIQYLSRRDREYLDEYRKRSSRWDEWGININWGNNSYVHQFNTQFGNLKTLYMIGRERVEIEFKDGKKIEVTGEGYNDIGGEIRVYDEELGEIGLRWSRIDKIEFMPTPKNLEDKFGDPLYGTVQTSIGDFTGYIQWDHDERITTDILNGHSEDGKLDIQFGKIKSIENDRSASIVVMQSGRKLYLRGTNDVNSENRGIIISDNTFGRVDIPWRDFRKVVFNDKLPATGVSYNDFSAPKELTGSVKTKSGEVHKGRIIYDLDEAYDMEVIQGMDDDIEFIIPIKHIRKIIPKNYSYATVELKNGKSYLLGDSQDVSDKNDGMLVFIGSDEPIYIPWDDVDEIIFN